MNLMLKVKVAFYVGIILPTLVTIGFFIGFLWCYFKGGIRQKFLDYLNYKRNSVIDTSTDKKDEAGEHVENASQHSADSAIDVYELELGVADNGENNEQPSLISGTKCRRALNTQHTQPLHSYKLRADSILVEAEVERHGLSRGHYPSHEKLDNEISVEPKIYESQEDVELAMYDSLARPTYDYIDTPLPSPRIPRVHNAQQCQRDARDVQIFQHSGLSNFNRNFNQRPFYRSAPRLPSRRPSHSSSIVSQEDNRLTDYGFAPWKQRPNSVCAGQFRTEGRKLQRNSTLPRERPSNIEWNIRFSESGADNLSSVEIIHV